MSQMITVVTDHDQLAPGSCEVITLDEFYAQGETDEGIKLGDKTYFDINCMTDDRDGEESYEAIDTALRDAEIDFEWYSSDEQSIPSWFNGLLADLPDSLRADHLDDRSMGELSSAMSLVDIDEVDETSSSESHIGRIITFGSAKGGSGKTFTSVITAIYYAKDHPDEKVCIIDLDIEEPQIAIVIKTLQPTLRRFYSDYYTDDNSFEALHKCATNNRNFPPNLDFYLTPREAHPIQNPDFWECVLTRLFENYDTVFIDTGTTYMETPAIATAYRAADKVIIVTMANLASTITVSQQIKRLTGEIVNDVYSESDDIGSKLNIVVTNAYQDKICESIIDKLREICPVITTFGNLTKEINEIQVLSKWDMFDNNADFRSEIRKIYA